MIPREVFAETLLQFFAPIRPFLDDPQVSDIMINGPDQIFVERHGLLELTGAKFESREALIAALRNAAQFVGKHIDEERPILEGRLPDGSRIEAVMPPAAPEGPHVFDPPLLQGDAHRRSSDRLRRDDARVCGGVCVRSSRGS